MCMIVYVCITHTYVFSSHMVNIEFSAALCNSKSPFTTCVAMETCLAPLRAWLRCTRRAEEKVSHALARLSKVSARNPWKFLRKNPWKQAVRKIDDERCKMMCMVPGSFCKSIFEVRWLKLYGI